MIMTVGVKGAWFLDVLANCARVATDINHWRKLYNIYTYEDTELDVLDQIGFPSGLIRVGSPETNE